MRDRCMGQTMGRRLALGFMGAADGIAVAGSIAGVADGGVGRR